MPNTILLFDHNAILGSDSHLWRGVSAIATCMIPQIVVDEINSVVSGFGNNIDNNKSQELIASEFLRFLPSSNWQISDVSATEPRLNQKLGSTISRNSRLDLAIAECAYGLALDPTAIILVTNTNSLLQVINELNQENLSAVTLAIVRTWVQNRQISTQRLPSLKATSRAVTVRNANYARLNKFVSVIIGWIVVVGIGLVAWRSLQPKEFKQFWQKTGLPNLIK